MGQGDLKSLRTLGELDFNTTSSNPLVRCAEETNPAPCKVCLQAFAVRCVAVFESSRFSRDLGVFYDGSPRIRSAGKMRGRHCESHFPAHCVRNKSSLRGRRGPDRNRSDPMKLRNPQDHPTSPPRRLDRAAQADPGDYRGEDVSPVLSDATGVRQDGGVRGRVDATRSRRRYITY
jgi:hypothetical protein